MKDKKRKLSYLIVFFLCLALWGCKKADDGTVADDAGCVHLKQDDKVVEIDNGIVKARFTIGQDGIRQEYFAKKTDKWVLVAESLNPTKPFPENGNKIYDSGIDKEHRLIVPEIVDSIQIDGQCKKKARVVLSGKSGTAEVAQTIELASGEDFFHIEVSAALGGQPPELEYLLSPFVFNIEGKPDFTHVPGLKRNPKYKPEDDQSNLIGDRVFFSPAAIVQKDGLFVALVPDVDIINESVVYARDARPVLERQAPAFTVPVAPDKISMPTALDLELESGLNGSPLISYGIIDFQIQQHVYYFHDNTQGAMVRTLSKDKVQYGMDLFLRADAPAHRGYQRVSRYLWERYGSKYFRLPRPQAMPYADYTKVCYPAAFSYKGTEIISKDGLADKLVHNEGPLESWQQWEIDGRPIGGLRLGTGGNWYELIYFASWWNNVYDAIGMYLWGQRLNDQSLIDKSRRIVNLALTAPQNEGMFPAYYHLEKKDWVRNLWKFPLEGYDPSERKGYWGVEDPDNSYQTASASVTAGFLMKYRRVCEDNPGIVSFVKNYGDFLIKNMQPNGCVPAWFDKELRPLPAMRWNADGGAHIGVLAELYRETKEDKYLNAARKMAQFIIDEVMSTRKWYDFESFYSCSIKSETFFDKRTGQTACNTMSMGWAIQGLTSLYEVTEDRTYLKAAEAVADYASFYQAVWSPHYIVTAYPFGGLSTQVGDAEWLDGRTHRFAEKLAKIGLLTNRQDLLERGVAAMRSALTLVNHPRLIKNNIYMHPHFPYGMGPENIDHGGYPQMPMRSGPSWSEVGGLAAASDLMRLLGSAYVNVEKQLAVGVNGIKIASYSFDNRTIRVKLENQLSALPFAYEKPFEIDLKVEGLPDAGQYTLIINSCSPVKLTAKELLGYRLTIQP